MAQPPPLSSAAPGSTRFIVVVPTRERCDTLEWTLRTCVMQEYPNCEIVVSDNASTDDTQRVVSMFRDPRIRYIQTGQRLSMARNWEFALRHAGDGYITFLGDDDGLMPNALSELDHLLRSRGMPEAVAWRKAEYVWPQFWLEALRNYLSVPLGTRIERRQARAMLEQMATWQFTYLQLPCLYNSFVARSTIQRATDGDGVFFHSCIPDVYSAIALASVLDEYDYSHRPYTINGASKHSTGGAHFLQGNDAPSASKFLAENDIPFHPELAMAPCAPIMAAESFLQVRDHLPQRQHVLAIDLPAMLAAAASIATGTQPQVYKSIAEAIHIIGEKNRLSELAEQLLARYPNQPATHSELVTGYRLPVQTLFLFANELGVANIYDAAIACKTIMALSQDNPFGPRNLLQTNLSLAPVYWERAKARLQRRLALRPSKR